MRDKNPLWAWAVIFVTSAHARPDVRNFLTSGNGCFQSPSFPDHVTKKRRALGTRMFRYSLYHVTCAHIHLRHDQETTGSGDENVQIQSLPCDLRAHTFTTWPHGKLKVTTIMLFKIQGQSIRQSVSHTICYLTVDYDVYRMSRAQYEWGQHWVSFVSSKIKIQNVVLFWFNEDNDVYYFDHGRLQFYHINVPLSA